MYSIFDTFFKLTAVIQILIDCTTEVIQLNITLVEDTIRE